MIENDFNFIPMVRVIVKNDVYGVAIITLPLWGPEPRIRLN